MFKVNNKDTRMTPGVVLEHVNADWVSGINWSTRSIKRKKINLFLKDCCKNPPK